MMKRATRPGPQIQLTPFVDILLNLLAFILVVGSLERTSPAQLGLELPRPRLNERGAIEHGLAITLDRDGRLWLEGVRIERKDLAEAVRARRGGTAILRADRRLPYELVVEILALIGENGGGRVRLAVLPAD